MTSVPSEVCKFSGVKLVPFTNKKREPSLATYRSVHRISIAVPDVSHRTSLPFPTPPDTCWKLQPVLPSKTSLMPKAHGCQFTRKAHSVFMLPETWPSSHGKFLPEYDFPSSRKPELAAPGPQPATSVSGGRHQDVVAGTSRGSPETPPTPGQPGPSTPRSMHRKWRPKCPAEWCPEAVGCPLPVRPSRRQE